jgi:hypothetical protein
MKEEIINGVRGLPEAAESNKENGREEAQKAQEHKSFFETLALFRGHSVASKWSYPVKLSQTDAAGQTGWQIICKYLAIKDLQNTRCFAQSNPVKVSQTGSNQFQGRQIQRLGLRLRLGGLPKNGILFKNREGLMRC